MPNRFFKSKRLQDRITFFLNIVVVICGVLGCQRFVFRSFYCVWLAEVSLGLFGVCAIDVPLDIAQPKSEVVFELIF